MNALNSATLPLSGTHLIEASAGTGKTYNITRLYLRLILEKGLSVEEILVMTFTKDATQELKGRIAETLNECLQDWDELSNKDSFIKEISKTIAPEQAKLKLRQALLCLDEASIFTIHGFCQRVLTEHAFATKQAISVQLETDVSDVMLQAVNDFYRHLATSDPEAFLLVAEFWPSPEKFLQSFAKALYGKQAIAVLSAQSHIDAFNSMIDIAIDSLVRGENEIQLTLIDKQKGSKRDDRIDEFNHLKQWLENLKLNLSLANQKLPKAFYNRNRYRTADNNQVLDEIFEPVKTVMKACEKINSNISKANAYTVVHSGVIQIRERFSQAKEQINIFSFDDLIAQLATAVQSSDELSQLLASQFPVALVDEFQDTDPDQFAILDAIYQPHNNLDYGLFMIGDPKQAIYGFRGGDVFAYLQARDNCQSQWVMDTNWRSSVGMIDGYNRLFWGNSLDEASSDVFGFGIEYQTVKASTRAKPELLEDGYAPLQLVHFNSDDKVPQSARKQMAIWAAGEINRLLASGQGLKANDIAILVRDGTEAASIKDALTFFNLPSVYLSNRSNLFESQESKALLACLKGILTPTNERLYKQALTSSLLGFSPKQYFELLNNDGDWQNQRVIFEALLDKWQKLGFMPMVMTLLHEHSAILSNDLDRSLTNYLHLFELCQKASQKHRSPEQLIHWLELHIQGKAQISETELRLESDDNLIKIVTQHGSKGLEYPVVFVPFASRFKNPLKVGSRNINLIEYHDDNKQLKISLDGDDSCKAKMAEEAFAEGIRLLYVAVTRAEKRCYLLSTEFDGFEQSPLGSTLRINKGQQLLSELTKLAESESIGLQVVELESVHAPDDSMRHYSNDELETHVSMFEGHIERDWWLSSFSALSKNMKNGGVSSPDRDELAVNPASKVQSERLRFTITKGAQTGNFLHDLMEFTDFSNPNWQQQISLLAHKYQHILTGVDNVELETWMKAITAAQLNKNLKLSDLTLSKTLREAEFYFPMDNAKAGAISKLLSDHRKNHSIKSQYPGVVLPHYHRLKGMMHGFIDLIFEHDGKYYVCDYKSTHLGDDFDDYSEAALKANIEKSYYDLQYLIYSLALHRYLQTSLADYSVAEHFGGIYYLYLRGMSPEHVNKGVYHREITESELIALDNLFQGEVIDA